MTFTGILSDCPAKKKDGNYAYLKMRKPFLKIETSEDFIEYSYVYMNGLDSEPLSCFEKNERQELQGRSIINTYDTWGLLNLHRYHDWGWALFIPEQPKVYAAFQYSSRPSRACFKRDLKAVGEFFDSYFAWNDNQLKLNSNLLWR